MDNEIQATLIGMYRMGANVFEISEVLYISPYSVQVFCDAYDKKIYPDVVKKQLTMNNEPNI